MKYFIFYLTLIFLVISCQQKSSPNVQKGMAEVNGTELYYEMVGSGEPLVLVHGAVGDRRHWDFQFKPLAKEFKVIRYDARGYGKSAFPEPGESYSNHEDLKGLLDHLGIEKAHLCGLSMGSRIITDFALAYPEMCKSFIPIGPVVRGYGEEYNTAAAESTAKVFEKLAKIAKEKTSKHAVDYFLTGNQVFKNTIRTEHTLEHLKMIMGEHSFWEFKHERKRTGVHPVAIKQLDNIQVPTLIVTAEHDLKFCKEIAEIMELKIPGSKKVTMIQAGHIMNIDQPEKFNTLVVDFIKGLE